MINFAKMVSKKEDLKYTGIRFSYGRLFPSTNLEPEQSYDIITNEVRKTLPLPEWFWNNIPGGFKMPSCYRRHESFLRLNSYFKEEFRPIKCPVDIIHGNQTKRYILDLRLGITVAHSKDFSGDKVGYSRLWVHLDNDDLSYVGDDLGRLTKAVYDKACEISRSVSPKSLGDPFDEEFICNEVMLSPFYKESGVDFLDNFIREYCELNNLDTSDVYSLDLLNGSPISKIKLEKKDLVRILPDNAIMKKVLTDIVRIAAMGDIGAPSIDELSDLSPNLSFASINATPSGIVHEFLSDEMLRVIKNSVPLFDRYGNIVSSGFDLFQKCEHILSK